MLTYGGNTVGYDEDGYVPMFGVRSEAKRIDFNREHMATFLQLVKESSEQGLWLDFLQGVADSKADLWGNAYLELLLNGRTAYVRMPS